MIETHVECESGSSHSYHFFAQLHHRTDPDKHEMHFRKMLMQTLLMQCSADLQASSSLPRLLGTAAAAADTELDSGTGLRNPPCLPPVQRVVVFLSFDQTFQTFQAVLHFQRTGAKVSLGRSHPRSGQWTVIPDNCQSRQSRRECKNVQVQKCSSEGNFSILNAI